MTATFSVLVPIVSALVGIVLGHILAERKSRNDELAQMRLNAYSDFLRATSQLVTARRSGRVQDDPMELSELNDAKARICVCADAPVVESLEQFWLQGGTLEKEQEIVAYTTLCRSMRASLGHDGLPLDTGVSDVLFKLEPSTYSYRASSADG